MTSPFQENGFFNTFKSQAELEEYLASFSGSDLSVATTTYGLVWNYLVHQFNEWLQSQQEPTDAD